MGTVTSVSGSTLKITTPQGDAVTVTTDAATRVTVIAKASLKDVKVGDQVRVEGTVDGTTVTATSLHLGARDFGPGGFGGARHRAGGDWRTAAPSK